MKTNSIRKKCTKINEILTKEFPNPISELTYSNDYLFLIAVVLSAQTTDRTVNKVMQQLSSLVQSPQDLLALAPEEIRSIIKSTGFFNSKTKNIIALSKQLIDKFNGIIPNTKDELTSLSGVGEKTANVILNHLFGKPVIAVDTHVFRVSHRLGLSNANTPEKVCENLENIFTNEEKTHIGNRLLLHGRYVCTAQKPKCTICKLQDICPSVPIFVEGNNSLQVK